MLGLVLCFLAVAMAGQNAPRLQRAHSADITFDPNMQYVVPKRVFEFLEEYNWGDYHQVFHMVRKYYFLGDNGRRWLRNVREEIPEFQEGDPQNGIEFLTMHRAMIVQLKDLFGDLPVTNDPEGFSTFAQVLDGWTTDEQVLENMKRDGKDWRTFERGLRLINDFSSFDSEDEFGNYIQTTLRLTRLDPHERSRRSYDYDRRPGAGVHNWMHGQYHDSSSKISVGNPRTNLHNIYFWRIHGWIEAKWKQFEAQRTRNADEQEAYDKFMKMFHDHMDGLSAGSAEQLEDEANRRSEQEEAARKEREERERREREAREQQEAARRQQEEAARREREARERREREARERQEAERRAREEAERQAREKAERERMAREEAARLAREKRERERQEAIRKAEEARQEAERRAEAERKAQEERERKAREEARRRREAELKAAQERARRAEEQRLAEEKRAREEAARRAEADRARRAAEEAARKAEEERARRERLRVEEEVRKAREEARRVAEEKLRAEAAAKKAREEAARREQERQAELKRIQLEREIAERERKEALEAQRRLEEERESAAREEAIRQAKKRLQEKKARQEKLRLERERLEKEREEAEKKKQEEEKKARERALEEERARQEVARVEAEKKKQEQERLDALARLEKTRKETEERERREEAERKRKEAELAEISRKAREEEERVRKQKEAEEAAEQRAEEERKAKERARLAAEEEAKNSYAEKQKVLPSVCSKVWINVRESDSNVAKVMFAARPGEIMAFDKSQSRGRWMFVSNSRGSGFTYFKPNYWGFCDEKQDLGEEFGMKTKFSGEPSCPKVWMKVRKDASMRGDVDFLARPGEKFYVDKSKSVGGWKFVQNSRGSGFSYFKPKYWGACHSEQPVEKKSSYASVRRMRGFKKGYRSSPRTGRKLLGADDRNERRRRSRRGPRGSYYSRYRRTRSKQRNSSKNKDKKKKKKGGLFNGFKKFFGKVFKVFRFGKKKVPKEIIDEVRPVMFHDEFSCDRYAAGVTCLHCGCEAKNPVPGYEPPKLDLKRFVKEGMVQMEKKQTIQ